MGVAGGGIYRKLAETRPNWQHDLMIMKRFFIFALCLLPLPALADQPVIENVKASQNGGAWRFDVTVSHPDTGWDHYADAWRVLDMKGNELGIRELTHPHETEQPFTRSLSGVDIPKGTSKVKLEARCLVDGWSGEFLEVNLE